MPFTFHPYLMQIASVNSCLFNSYPIALIGKDDSQEDAPFPLLLLLVVVTQGSFPPKVHHRCFCIFHFSLVVLFFVSGELLVRGVVVKVKLSSVHFGFQFISDLSLSRVLVFRFGSFLTICQTQPTMPERKS